jgi:hypothetical protein
MSLVVAAATAKGAALATDSVWVDLETREVRVNMVKHVVVGSRVAALTGVSDVPGFSVLAALEQACASASNLEDLPDLFAQLALPTLAAAWPRWASTLGPAAQDESMVAAIVIGREDNVPRLFELQSFVENDRLSIRGNYVTPRPESAVVAAAGVVDDQTAAHTTIGRLHDAMTRRTLESAPMLEPDATGARCGQFCKQIVGDALERQGRLPRPQGWPPNTPLIAGPVQIALLG